MYIESIFKNDGVTITKVSDVHYEILIANEHYTRLLPIIKTVFWKHYETLSLIWRHHKRKHVSLLVVWRHCISDNPSFYDKGGLRIAETDMFHKSKTKEG